MPDNTEEAMERKAERRGSAGTTGSENKRRSGDVGSALRRQASKSIATQVSLQSHRSRILLRFDHVDTPETRSWRPLARNLLDIVLPLQISTNSSS